MSLQINNNIIASSNYDLDVRLSENDVNVGSEGSGPQLNPNGSADIGNREPRAMDVFDRAENASKARAALAAQDVSVSVGGTQRTGLGEFEIVESGSLVGSGKIGGKDAQAIDEAVYSADQALKKLGTALKDHVGGKALKKAFSAAHKAQLKLAATIKRAKAPANGSQLDALMVRAFKRAQVLEKLLVKISSSSTRAGEMSRLQDKMSDKDASHVADVLDDDFTAGIKSKKGKDGFTFLRTSSGTDLSDSYAKFLKILSGKMPEMPTTDELKKALRDLETEMMHLQRAVRPGPEVLSGKSVDPESLFAFDLADKIGEVCVGLRAKIALCEQVEKIFSPPPELESLKNSNSSVSACNTLRGLRNMVMTAVVTGDADLWQKARDAAKSCTKDLRVASNDITSAAFRCDSSQKAYDTIVEFLKKKVPQLPHFVSLLQHMPEVSMKDVARIEDGSYRVQDYVVTLAMGLSHDDLVPKTDFTSVDPFDKGVVSQTFLCTDANGAKSVFKPELTSFYGIEYGVVGRHSQTGVDGFATATAVNMATKDIALAGGPSVGSVIVGTKVGHVNEQYGMLMEYSPGVGLNKLLEQMDPGYVLPEYDKITLGEGGATVAQILDLDIGPRQELLGRIAQQMNRLQWLDALTGQLDRHGNNYLLYVSPDLKTVEVKGIDNDAAFPTSVTKFGEYTLSKTDAENFLASARKYFKGTEDEFNATYKKLKQNRMIQSQNDDGLLIHFNDDIPPAFKMAFIGVTGIKNPSLPSYIDKEMYDLIKHFTTEEGLKEYKGILKRRNLSDEQIDAAVERLSYLSSKIEGRFLVEGPGWTEVMAEQMGKPPKEVTSKDVNSEETSAGLSRYVNADYFRQGAMWLLLSQFAEPDSGQQPLANDISGEDVQPQEQKPLGAENIAKETHTLQGWRQIMVEKYKKRISELTEQLKVATDDTQRQILERELKLANDFLANSDRLEESSRIEDGEDIANPFLDDDANDNSYDVSFSTGEHTAEEWHQYQDKAFEKAIINLFRQMDNTTDPVQLNALETQLTSLQKAREAHNASQQRTEVVGEDDRGNANKIDDSDVNPYAKDNPNVGPSEQAGSESVMEQGIFGQIFENYDLALQQDEPIEGEGVRV